MHIDSVGSPTMVFIYLDASGFQAEAGLPRIREPLHACCSISYHRGVINISLNCQHAGDSVKVGENWIHGNAKEQD